MPCDCEPDIQVCAYAATVCGQRSELRTSGETGARYLRSLHSLHPHVGGKLLNRSFLTKQTPVFVESIGAPGDAFVSSDPCPSIRDNRDTVIASTWRRVPCSFRGRGSYPRLVSKMSACHKEVTKKFAARVRARFVSTCARTTVVLNASGLWSINISTSVMI